MSLAVLVSPIAVEWMRHPKGFDVHISSRYGAPGLVDSNYSFFANGGTGEGEDGDVIVLAEVDRGLGGLLGSGAR